ncbi:hypothetical protein O6466_25170, partial [Salmonella enterica subsp. enterica]
DGKQSGKIEISSDIWLGFDILCRLLSVGFLFIARYLSGAQLGWLAWRHRGQARLPPGIAFTCGSLACPR